MLIVRIRDLFEQVIVFADWLQKCGIRTMAMEATGVDGIPLFELREARGREVCLVNAEHVRPVPGRKSDVKDCQWLQKLLQARMRLWQRPWVQRAESRISLAVVWLVS